MTATTTAAHSAPRPQFKVGDAVFMHVNSRKRIGEVVEIRDWGDGCFSYRINGNDFHPRQYYSEAILTYLPF